MTGKTNLELNIRFQEIHDFYQIIMYYRIFMVSLSNNYVCTSPEGDMIRELCLQRDNDDFI